MASIGHPEAESLILKTLALESGPSTSDDEKKRLEWKKEAAAEALCMLRGIPQPVDLAYEKCENRNRIPPISLMNIVLVSDIDAEVNNGGFDQYFFNNSGDQADKAIHALQAIGATGKAQILRKSLALFGPQGPSKNREERHHQREKMLPSDADKLRELDRFWYDDKENIRLLLYLYASVNRAAFK